ncbi:hypothetical protein O181_008336 [Austropuccinia psidii MF-1]|uniref:Uncharacterized protein n=1 Tax=Austropuccinia psidii MF-1 TaxID=1389203 RepID=A0A9Q3BPN1_9BASI|nr:hypothetical protein [Austropuccinia psidii MF-1]
MRPSPIPQPKNPPMVASQQLQPVASSSRRRKDQLPFPLTAAQVFQQRQFWPIQATREDPKMENEVQDSMASLFIRVDRYSRDVIEYANDRTISDKASEEMAEKISCYEGELINDF